MTAPVPAGPTAAECVEKVARVLADDVANLLGGCTPWDSMPEDERETWREPARAVVAALLPTVKATVADEIEAAARASAPVDWGYYERVGMYRAAAIARGTP